MAIFDEALVGLMDIEITAESATIEVVAVHPASTGGGIATALLDHVWPELKARGVATLDAWTREDVPANRWYRSHGFLERYRYLHIHKEWDEDDAGFTSPPGFSPPIRAFLHAPIEREDELRARFRRVYVCRQYVRDIAGS